MATHKKFVETESKGKSKDKNSAMRSVAKHPKTDSKKSQNLDSIKKAKKADFIESKNTEYKKDSVMLSFREAKAKHLKTDSIKKQKKDTTKRLSTTTKSQNLDSIESKKKNSIKITKTTESTPISPAKKEKKYDPQTLAQSLHNADNIAYMIKNPYDEAQKGEYFFKFLQGDFKDNEASFIKNENGDEFIMLPKDAITHILSILQDTREESLKLMLRYAIKDLMPFDLEDAMAVAMSELEARRLENGNLPTIDIKHLAKTIHIKHPNLFFTNFYQNKL